MTDQRVIRNYAAVDYRTEDIPAYLEQLLQLEAVACKHWLTNKVDRCVGGRVAKQQCVGSLQLPLNNVGVMALDYRSTEGVARSEEHTSELQSLMRISYAVFCLQKKKNTKTLNAAANSLTSNTEMNITFQMTKLHYTSLTTIKPPEIHVYL